MGLQGFVDGCTLPSDVLPLTTVGDVSRHYVTLMGTRRQIGSQGLFLLLATRDNRHNPCRRNMSE
jgi:hypothetical protein